MDYKQIRENKIQMNNLTSRLNILEELHKETLEKIKFTQESCNHDLIFINRKYENKAYEYIQYGKCLVCGKGMTLTSNNVDIDSFEVVESDRIIDVANKVEKWDIECDCKEDKLQLDIAQRVFDDMIIDSDCFYSKDCIKREIIVEMGKIKEINKKK